MPLDADGAIRRVADQVEGLESFAVVTAEVATNRQVVPFDERRSWVRYAGPPGTVRAYSFAAVLQGRVARGVAREDRRRRDGGAASQGRVDHLDDGTAH